MIDRLEEEHEVISDVIERVDRAMLGLVNCDPDGMEKARTVFDLFSDAPLSHSAYEERGWSSRSPGWGFY